MTDRLTPAVARRPLSIRGRRAPALFPYLLIMPTALVMLVILGYPIYQVMRLSVFNGTLFDAGVFVGLQNYVEVLTDDPLFWKVLLQTLVWTVASVGIEFIFSLFIALLLNQFQRGRAFFRGVMLLPWIIPPVAAALVWRTIYDSENGFLNTFLDSVGFSGPLWLSDSDSALGSVVVVSVWKYSALMIVGLLAALQSIPSEVYEAAAVDGASRSRVFWHITLPSIMPLASVLIILSVIFRAGHFDLIALMTGGGPANSTQLISTYAYETSMVGFEVGTGATIAILGALAIFALTFRFLRLLVRLDMR